MKTTITLVYEDMTLDEALQDMNRVNEWTHSDIYDSITE